MNKLAFGLLLLSVGVASAACAAKGGEAASRTNYRCHGGKVFNVAATQAVASVTYAERRYLLPRRKSGIGTRYASAEATLIIDGPMAVFVTSAITDLQACRADY